MGQFRHGNVGIGPYYDARAKIRGDERDSRVARVEKAKEEAARDITDLNPTTIDWQSGYDPSTFDPITETYDTSTEDAKKLNQLREKGLLAQEERRTIAEEEAKKAGQPDVVGLREVITRDVDPETQLLKKRGRTESNLYAADEYYAEHGRPFSDRYAPRGAQFFKSDGTLDTAETVNQFLKDLQGESMAEDQLISKHGIFQPRGGTTAWEYGSLNFYKSDEARKFFASKKGTEHFADIFHGAVSPVEKYKELYKKGLIKQNESLSRGDRRSIIQLDGYDEWKETHGVNKERKPIDEKVVEEVQSYQYTDDKGLALAEKTINNFDANINNQHVRQLLPLANEIGVNWNAAIALMAIESNYGTDNRVSPSGAMGKLQIMPATYHNPKDNTGIKNWFINNPENKKFPDKLKKIAQSLPKDINKATDKQLMQAGLLRIKYMELKKVKPEHWGAAYNQSAEEVIKNDGPLNKRDGIDEDGDGIPDGTHNADFNNLYLDIYQRVNDYYGDPTAQEELPGVNVSKHSGLTAAEGGLETSTKNDVTRTIEASKGYVTSPDKLTYDQEKALSNRQLIAQITEIYRKNGLVEEYAKGLTALQAADEKLYFLEGMRGLLDLKNGNAGKATYILRRATQQNYDIRPVVDANGQLTNKFSVYIDGKPVEGLYQKGWGTVQDYIRKKFDNKYLQSTITRDVARAEKKFDMDIEITKKALEQLNDIEGKYGVERIKLGQFDKNIKETTDGNFIFKSNSGRLYQIFPEGKEIKSKEFGDKTVYIEEIPGLPQHQVFTAKDYAGLVTPDLQ